MDTVQLSGVGYLVPWLLPLGSSLEAGLSPGGTKPGFSESLFHIAVGVIVIHPNISS